MKILRSRVRPRPPPDFRGHDRNSVSRPRGSAGPMAVSSDPWEALRRWETRQRWVRTRLFDDPRGVLAGLLHTTGRSASRQGTPRVGGSR